MDVLETAVFTNVEMKPIEAPAADARLQLYSTLETVTVASTDRRVAYFTQGRIEAPNWSPDGNWLVYNGNGRLHKISPSGGTPETIDTGFASPGNAAMPPSTRKSIRMLPPCVRSGTALQVPVAMPTAFHASATARRSAAPNTCAAFATV